MSTVMVYSETFKDRSKLDNPAREEFMFSPEMLDQKFTIWQSKDKVGIAESVLVTGKWRNNGKRWFQWKTNRAWGLRRTSTGHPMPYFSVRPWTSTKPVWTHGKPNVVFDAMETPELVSEAFYEAYMRALEESFKVKTMADVYPMVNEFGIWKYDGIAGNIRVAMREKNIEDMVGVLFGKGRANRNWFDAVRDADPYITAVAHQFRGLTPDKDVLEFVKETDFDAEGFRPHTPRLRPILYRLDRTSLPVLLKNGLSSGDADFIQGVCGEGINVNGAASRVKIGTAVKDWSEVNQVGWGRRVVAVNPPLPVSSLVKVPAAAPVQMPLVNW